MNKNLRITSQSFEIARQDLTKDGREQFEFWLCEKMNTPKNCLNIVREILIPDEEDMKAHRAAFVEPNHKFQFTAYEIAARKGYTLIDCHTHPFQQTPSFSSIDIQAAHENAEFIAKHIPHIDFGLIVFGKEIKAYSGMIYDKAKKEFIPIDSIEILGSPTNIMFNRQAPKKHTKSEIYSRHDIIPGWNQSILPDLRVAVLGAGGIGAEIFQKLVCLGTAEGKGELIIIDHDLVEESNIPRIPYANAGDIGKAKVEVAERYARFKNKNINVTAIQKKAQEKEVQEILATAHILFGCVDSEGARKILNQISAEYNIPYIDAASEIIPENKGYHAGGQVRTIIPGEGCLLCIGGIDLSEAARDMVTEEVEKDYKKAGYIRGTNKTPTPSVLHFNSTISSIAISQFTKLIFGESLKGQKAVFYDQQKMSITAADFEKNEKCPLCGEKPVKPEKEKSLEKLEKNIQQDEQPASA